MIPNLQVAFDLETADEAEMFARPDFIRLAGYSTGYGVRQTTDVAEVMAAIGLADTIVGHNVMAFDLIALARWAGLDLQELVRENRVLDTKLIAFLQDPPPARMGAGWIEKFYSLDSVGDRLVGQHKHGDLRKIAKRYGGYDRIDVNDLEFMTYLDQDVNLSLAVLDALDAGQAVTPYALREHRVAGLAAQVTLNGFRVDKELVIDRVAGVVARRKELIERLVSEYGLPMLRKDGSPSAAPQNTQEGRAAIKAAFEAAGAPYQPKTPKGAWATGSEAMKQMIDYYRNLPEVIELAEVVMALNGQRTVYETTRDNMIDEDSLGWRTHPRVALRQASGRWSLTRPGLTVMGKRGGRHIEREIFVPDAGETIVCIDLAQIDARAVAVLSQDQNYMDMFKEGVDLHSEVALRVFGDRGMREPAKVAGHGWNYGLGVDGLVKTFGIERNVAVEFHRSMREQFPRLVEWKSEMAELAKSGALLDNGFGRQMRPDVARAYTQGPALMGQGCARDLLMEGMLHLPPEILPMLRGVVHDEIVLSIPNEIVDDVEKVAVDALSFEWVPPGMPNARPISVVADVAGRSSVSWGAAYAKDSKPAVASPTHSSVPPVATDVDVATAVAVAVGALGEDDDDDFW
jgi:DNA polymerase-1